ncbi:meiotic W68 [Carabus blaptoides fortunei]
MTTEEVQKNANDKSDTSSMLESEEKILKAKADIEVLIDKLAQETIENSELIFVIRINKSWENCEFDEMLCFKSDNVKMREVKFSEDKSRFMFSLITFALAEIYNLLVSEETCTKSMFYYKGVDRFPSQLILDGILSDITCMLNVPLYELNIYRCSRGLIYGPLKIIIENNETDCSNCRGVQIPDNVFKTCYIKSDAKYIVLIEKEAIFKNLLDNGAPVILKSWKRISKHNYKNITEDTMEFFEDFDSSTGRSRSMGNRVKHIETNTRVLLSIQKRLALSTTISSRYRKGSLNQLADTLSRQPLPSGETSTDLYALQTTCPWYNKKLREVRRHPQGHPDFQIRDRQLYRRFWNSDDLFELGDLSEWKKQRKHKQSGICTNRTRRRPTRSCQAVCNTNTPQAARGTRCLVLCNSIYVGDRRSVSSECCD